jgi:hypothetical protein
MNQLAMEFTPRRECVVPSADTIAGKILRALQAGERLTPLSALNEFQCLSLSQRVGELKRMGWPISSRPCKTPSGKTVAEYSMEQA